MSPAPERTDPRGSARLPPATERFAAHVGAEARARPEPSLSSALGGVLTAAGGFGVVVLGADAVVQGGSRIFIAIFCAAYGIGGAALLTFGHRVHRTGGVVALSIAIPSATAFLVTEVGGLSSTDVTTVLAVSTVAWAVLHVAGPARGHGFLLGAALLGAWATVLTRVGADAPALINPLTGNDDVMLFGSRHQPTAPALASLAFGVAYLLAGRWLDSTGLRGTATGFLVAGLASILIGVPLATEGRSDVTTGTVVLLAGAFVGWTSLQTHRRAASWIGAAGIGLGVTLLAASPFHSPRAAAIAAVVSSAVLVMGLPLLARSQGLRQVQRRTDKPLLSP